MRFFLSGLSSMGSCFMDCLPDRSQPVMPVRLMVSVSCSMSAWSSLAMSSATFLVFPVRE